MAIDGGEMQVYGDILPFGRNYKKANQRIANCLAPLQNI